MGNYTALTIKEKSIQDLNNQNKDEKVDKGSKRYRNIQLTIFLSGLSVFAQLYLFQPLLPTVAKDFHISIGDSSLLVSSSTFGMALGLLFFAFKADGLSRKKQMSFALVGSSILTIASTWVYSLNLLVIIGVLKGFIIAGVSSVAIAYLTEELKAVTIGLSISMYLNGNTIGGLSGRVVAIIFEGLLGWRNTVLIIGLISLILAVIFWKYFPESKHFVPQKTNFNLKLMEMKNYISNAYLLRLFIIGFLLMGSFVSLFNYISFRLEEPPFLLNRILIAYIFMVYIFGLVGNTIVGKLSEKVKEKKLLIVSILMMLLGTFFFLSNDIEGILFGLILITMSFFAAHSMVSRLIVLQFKNGKSSATSLYWLFYYMGSAVLGSGIGYFLHATSWSSFVVLLLVLIMLALNLSIRKRNRNDENLLT